jgi:tetratricopeptide (TPR) repeat protein
MKTQTSWHVTGGALLLLCTAPAVATAQGTETLVKAKALYAEASYDDALRVLATTTTAEAHQYRALCYLALGKTQDAERAVEALIAAAPGFTVSESDSPPRLVAMFTQTRRRVLPAVARRLLGDARSDYQAKDMQGARSKFEQLLALTRDPLLVDTAEAKDLQLLAAGYMDLLGPATPEPLPARAAAMVTTAAPAAVKSSLPVVKARPAHLVPAEIIRQDVPAYTSPSGAIAAPLSGVVRVQIGTDGTVKRAIIEDPVEPRYDARLLAAARGWRYKPATLDGKPVDSEKVVTVHVGMK